MRRAAFLILAAAYAHAAPRATAEPPAVVLGRDPSVAIRVTDLAPAPLSVQSSVGTLTEERREPGARIFRWTPPDVRYPGVALLLFWQPGPAGPEATAVRIPLTGQTILTMETEPTASVEAQVGDEVFGPVLANARGRVALPIQVPPGVRRAVVTATARGRQTTRHVDLDVPQARPWIAAVGPNPLPPEGGWLVVVHAGHLGNEDVRVGSTGAAVQPTPSADPDQLLFRVIPEERAESVMLEVVGPGAEPRRLLVPVSRAPSVSPMPAARAESWLRLNALVGGYALSGANSGPAFEVGASVALPGRFRAWGAELVVGARHAALRGEVEILGPAESSLLVFPIDAAIRRRVLQIDRFGLDLRAGVGIAPFRHTISAAYQSRYAEGGIGFDTFGAAQGRYAIGRWELALELRGAFTTARTSRLEAHPGGFSALVGGGWAVP